MGRVRRGDLERRPPRLERRPGEETWRGDVLEPFAREEFKRLLGMVQLPPERVSISGGATEYLEFLNGERVLSVGQIVALLSDAMLTVLRDAGLTEVSTTSAGTTRTVLDTRMTTRTTQVP